MPYTEQGLPFAADSHESYQAAIHAAKSRGVKTRRYLRLLAERGPLTDHEVHAITGWPLSSINSIRNGVMSCGLVEKGSDTKLSPYGMPCRTWQLSESGQGAVARMGEQ